MSNWTIIGADGDPIAANVQGETSPDPAAYGGVSVLENARHIDTASMLWADGIWQVDLAKLKAAASARVNASAEAVIGDFLTPGAGQAMTYIRKEAEARAWTNGADEAAFPILSAEASALAITVEALAAIVIAKADAWVRIGSAINALRRAALVAIETAETLEEIEDAQAVDWSVIG